MAVHAGSVEGRIVRSPVRRFAACNLLSGTFQYFRFFRVWKQEHLQFELGLLALRVPTRNSAPQIGCGAKSKQGEQFQAFWDFEPGLLHLCLTTEEAGKGIPGIMSSTLPQYSKSRYTEPFMNRKCDLQPRSSNAFSAFSARKGRPVDQSFGPTKINTRASRFSMRMLMIIKTIGRTNACCDCIFHIVQKFWH